MKAKFRILLSLFALLTLAACDSQDSECRKDLRKDLGVALYIVDTNADGTIAEPRSFTPDSMSVKGLKMDSVLYRTSRANFNLPVSKTDTISSYEIFIRHDDENTGRHILTTDTLTITYDNEQHFVSLECGCYINHQLHSAVSTTHFTDSLHIINQNITNADETHINIYLH